MTKTVAITGATGNIGAKLRGHFERLGWRLRLLDLTDGGDPAVLASDLTVWDERWASQLAGVDAVILLDGLHSSYKPGTAEVEGLLIEPVLRFAERAKKGERLLVITHSNIKPEGYLGVRETVDYMLGKLSLERHEASSSSSIPRLRAAKGVLPEGDLRPLELRTEVRVGGLIIRGFGGDQPAHHISHLMQMSVLALPELAKRWAPKDDKE